MAKNSTLSNEVSTTNNRPSVNTEKKGENEPTETKSTSQEWSQNNSTMKHTVNAENSVTDLENKTTDNEIDIQNQRNAPVTAENSVELGLSIPENVNTENINTETDKEVITETNKSPDINDIPIQEQEGININTEKTTPDQAQPTNSTLKTWNQKNIKEDWSSLMFSSDDSFFNEMTKQLEDDTTRTGTNRKSPRKSPTSTIMTASTSMQEQETLPDIVYSGKTTDTVTGLLILGVDPKELDTEIDNELVMLVHKPKQPDFSKPNTEAYSKEQNKCKKKKRSRDHTESPRRCTR